MSAVLVLSTSSDDAKKILWCMREAGHRAFAIGPRDGNEALVRSPLLDGFFELPERFSEDDRAERLLAPIAEAVARQRIDVVIPSGYASLKFVSRHQDRLRAFARATAVPSPEMIAELGNKRSFAQFCEKHGLPHPRTVRLERAGDALRDRLGVSFPLMTKPFNLADSVGIRRFDDEASLRAYLAKPAADGSNALPLLLQEYVPGEDIDFNGFCVDGRLAAWSIQRFRWFSGGVRWLQFERHDEVLRIGRRVVELSRYNGPIHMDLRLDSRDGGVKTIEVNTRFWGSMPASMCDGVNFGDAAVRLAFDPGYTQAPLYANRVWGMPHRIPGLLLKHHDREFFGMLSRHTALQLKMTGLDALFSLTAKARSALSRGSDEALQ